MKKLLPLVLILFSFKTIAQNPFYDKIQGYLPEKANNLQNESRGIMIDSSRTFNFTTLKDSVLLEIKINTTNGNSRVQKVYTPTRKIIYKDSFYTTPKLYARYSYRENLSNPNDTLQLVNYAIEYLNAKQKRDSTKTTSVFISSSGLYELTRYKTLFFYNTKNKLIKDSLYKGVYPNPLELTGYSNYEYDTNDVLTKITTTNFFQPSRYTIFTYPDTYTNIQETFVGNEKQKVILKYYDTKGLYLKELSFFEPNSQGQLIIGTIISFEYDKNNNLIRLEGDYPQYNFYSLERTAWDACNQEKRTVVSRGVSQATLKLENKTFHYKDCLKVDVKENSALDNIVIFPNPTNNELFIQSEKELTKIEIRDIMGRIVLKSDQNLDKINVSHLLSGIYIISIYTDNKYKAIKFTKE